MLTYGLNVVTTPEVSLYPSELFLALNRFIAVFLWNKYHRIFTTTTTVVRSIENNTLTRLQALIIFSWLAGLSVLGETLARGNYQSVNCKLPV